MTHTPSIKIGERTYRLNPECDRYQVPIGELGTLRMIDIPAHSHLEVLKVPFPGPEIECEMWLVNGGDPGTDEYLSVYGGASIPVTPENSTKALDRLRRAFPRLHPYDARRNPEFKIENFANRGLKAHVFLSLNFETRGKTTVRDAIEPFVSGFRRLSRPDLHVFICHASEDKPFVRTLARTIEKEGVGVWLDELEIRVGDSIVQKISDGLQGATHLVIVLSKYSASKPWVTKEFSAALMRQLSDRSITVLPLRLDDSPLPVLLSDIKYADCGANTEQGTQDLLSSIYWLPSDA